MAAAKTKANVTAAELDDFLASQDQSSDACSAKLHQAKPTEWVSMCLSDCVTLWVTRWVGGWLAGWILG